MSGVFPNPHAADENGILCVGGNYSSQLLIEAYRNGIFPWPHDNYPMMWFSPNPRGVIFLENSHLPKSLKKWIRQNPLKITYNQAFDKVINECKSVPRKGQDGTWITDELEEGYKNFHRQGFAYSVEAWQNQKIVAGLYGVNMGSFLSAESMYHKVDNASKALLYLFLQDMASQGIEMVDLQMLTPTSESLGGEYISREDFIKILKKQVNKKKPQMRGFLSKDLEL